MKYRSGFTPSLKFRLPQSVPSGASEHIVLESNGFAPALSGRQKNQSKFSAGFTLIETLVYLGLFSILIGGALVAAFGIFESNGRNQTKAIVQSEGAFLLAKIDWALSGVQSVDEPPAGPLGGSLLSVRKSGGGTIKISLPDPSNPNVEIQRDLAPAKILNNSNVEIINLLFTHKNPGGGNPESVEARFTVAARTPTGTVFTEEFFTVKYIRR